MNIDNINSGILDLGQTVGWPESSHAETNRSKSYDRELSEVLEDLIRNTGTEEVVRQSVLSVLCRFGLTSWGEERDSINFWCNGIDAKLAWDVATNPLNRLDPPICTMSVKMQDDKECRAFYGCVVAGINACGREIISRTVQSLIYEATEDGGQ
jgi:hypothetical protein